MLPDEDTKEITPEQLIAKYQNVQGQPSIKALEDLDSIDWSMLDHAYGKATDVPALLRAVLSNDKKDQEFSLSLLFGTIWHQGTVYEASAYVVPFLLKALESSETPDKTAIAFLLASLADGHSYLEVHALPNEKSKNTWRKILEKDNRDLEVEVAKEIEYVKATRKEIEKGLHLLFPYLYSEDISAYVAKAMAFYPERKVVILPLLEEALISVNDKNAKAEIQSTMAKLRENNES